MQSLRAPRPTSIAVVIATFLALVAQILTSSPAAAHDGGWGWRNYPGSGHRLLWVYYDNNCSPYDFEVAVNSAAYNWTATYTPLEFSLASNSGCNTHWQGVDTFTGYDGGSGAGIAWTENYQLDCPPIIPYCAWDYSWLRIDQTIIRMNTYPGNNFGDLDAFGKVNAMTHEMGHSLGLGHVPCNYALSIMNTGGCNDSINTPQPHDISDINMYYPGW